MSKDPNQIDIDDYYDLTEDERTQLDKWLKSLGGDPIKTRSITIDRSSHKIFTEEYVLDRSGKMVYDRKLKDVEVNHRAFTYKEDPPVWK